MTLRKWWSITMLVLASVAGAAVGGTAAHASSIHEIKIDGAPAEQVETLKTLSGLLPGDDVDPNRLGRGVQRIREYLDSKGYPQAKVSTEVMARNDKATVVLHVALGDPIRMMEVTFSAKEGALPAELSARLGQVVEIKPGEPMDRDRLKDFKRLIESTLTGLDFVDSRVVDVRSIDVTGGVRLNFVIELGERVIFSVYGNQYFTRTELMTIIEEQTQLGLGRDFISVIQSRLADRYVEHGYRHVTVTPYVFEARGNTPRKVAYEIVEGAKLLIRDVTFDGNESFSEEELADLFFLGANERIQARIYNEKMVEEAGVAMIEALKRKGYLSAKLIATKSEESADLKTINLRFFLNEGVRTIVQAIDFQGNRNLPAERLLADLGLKEGDPLDLVQLEDGLVAMKRTYRNHGFLDVKVSNENSGDLVRYSEKNQYAYLKFVFDEGPELRLSAIRIYGNETTKSEVIEREIQLKPGDVLIEDRIIETEGRLRRLGVFNQVKLDLTADTGSELTRNMKISVIEGVPGNAGIGVGFRNDLGLRVFGEVSYSNLWGLNHGWALNLSANRRLGGFLSGQNNRVSDFRFVEVEAKLSYFWPWVFWGETTFRPSLIAGRRQYLRFDAETYAFNLSFDRMLYAPLKLSSGLTYTLERVRQYGAEDVAFNRQLRIGSITPSVRIDLRDSPLAPRKGFFGLTSFEYADTFMGSQADPSIAYGRFQVRTDYYIDLIPRVIWYTSVRGGWIKNFAHGSSEPIPIIKQFTLGGINSLRGFNDQELNQQGESIFNFQTFVNYRTQTDFLISQNLTIGPFLDAGNLLKDDFSLGKLRYGTGVGMRYLTPIGPVNFDFGMKLFPKPGESSNIFYFSLGVI